MCRAFFSGPVERPQLAGTVAFVEEEIAKEVLFLIDTGADVTSITELDALDIGLHPSQLPDRVPVIEGEADGIGGSADTWVIEHEMMLGFEEHHEDREAYSLHVEHIPHLCIVEGASSNLLGRDVLHRFSMEYKPGKEHIELIRDNYSSGHYSCMVDEEEISPELFDFD